MYQNAQLEIYTALEVKAQSRGAPTPLILCGCVIIALKLLSSHQHLAKQGVKKWAYFSQFPQV